MDFTELFDQLLNESILKYAAYKSPSLKDQPAKLEKLAKAMRFGLKQNYADIFTNLPLMAKIAEHFGDEASLQTYTQELVYVLFSLEAPKFAVNYTSPVDPKEFDQKYQSDQAELSKLLAKLNIADTNSPQYMSDFHSIFFQREYEYLSADNQVLFGVEPGEVVIDGGAYIGDTALWFYQEGAAQVHSFEPIATTFEILKSNLQKHQHDPNLNYPFALTDQRREIAFVYRPDHLAGNFAPTPAAWQEIDKDPNYFTGLTEKQVLHGIDLDSWCEQHQVQPTLIKLDIEGEEENALKGMRNVISTIKPKLAVCLYHLPYHMWRLPQLILEYNPNYTFYCKKSTPAYETVLFAVDRSK